ncbi:energy-coupling factor transporter transmembrane protein EcfT [Nesterenkonia sp. HG001]|uniref:energy-coupling factor transporter transmembrane component T family protein n=1 Tax=Nesterenkonia sp. HG001 TaxID=2983207 RepID=UPI002AC7D4B0|nr:energy-coupling factor transporter transmembrane protein EcfT [Nesterenkonia sp. HG001]MDZ5076902.1 energy-coupling factor transporter transmembrane protein EcfT [Nesterenkonia sp. HG001]
MPLHRPGTSLLHRTGVATKFLLVFLFALAVSLQRENVWVVLGAWALVLLGHLAAGVGAAGLLRRLWGLRWILIILTVPQLIFLDPQTTALNVSRVVAVIMVAGLFTLTTRTTDIMTAFDRALRPLGRCGVDTSRISLALSLTIRSVPVILAFSSQIQEALRARGRRMTPKALVMPLLVMSLRHAEETAEALAARGVR